MNTPSGQITTTDPHVAVHEWFERLGRYCALVDYEAARAIFADDVVAFGTNMEIEAGLDSLQQNQWEGIWPNISDFRFDLGRIHVKGESERAWGVATWLSTGFDDAGRPFDRPGRATVVLERREGRWLAVHTHFSLVPGTPQRTYGSRS